MEIHKFLETVEMFAWEVGQEEANQKQRRNARCAFLLQNSPNGGLSSGQNIFPNQRELVL